MPGTHSVSMIWRALVRNETFLQERRLGGNMEPFVLAIAGGFDANSKVSLHGYTVHGYTVHGNIATRWYC